MTTDLKLPALPQGDTYSADGSKVFTYEQMQERDRQIVELCAEYIDRNLMSAREYAEVLRSLLPKEHQ